MKIWIALFVLLAAPLRAEVAITPVTSPSGLNAWLVEEHSIPFVAIEVIFAGGATLDSDEQAGAVNLMTSLLSEGAGEMDAQAFAARSEELATRLSFSAGRDSISVSARFLIEDAEAVIDHLRLALTQPRFDEDAIARVRGQIVAQLRRDALDPNTLASQAFARTAFGAHPYGRESNGTAETVAGLDRDALIAAHRGAITRNGVFIGAAGDITAEDLGLLLDRLFEGIPECGPRAAPTCRISGRSGLGNHPL
jgi:zinc protease